MKSFRLTALQLNCFRGSTNKAVIKFDESKPLVLVFGENGTGKSTIVDAFDMIANGRVGSLENRSSAKITHAPSIGKKSADVKVTLSRSSDSWTGTFRGAKPQITSSTETPCIDILRRSQLLQLVEAIPSKRYEALQRFIDVAGVESSELELAKAIDLAAKEVASANATQTSVQSQLTQIWAENGSALGSWREWAKSKAESSPTDLETNIQASQRLLVAVDNFEKCMASHETARETLSNAEVELSRFVLERETLQSRWSDHAPQLIESLESTVTLLDAGWEADACPVCQQPISVIELRQRVSQSLEAMQALSLVYSNEKKARTNRELADNSAKSALDSLTNAMVEITSTFRKSTLSIAKSVNIDFDLHEAMLKTAPLTAADLSTVIDNCKRMLESRKGLMETSENLQRDKFQLLTIQTALKNYDTARTTAASTTKVLRKLSEMHEELRELRISFVQKILDEVSLEVDNLYQKIHPNESIGAVRFALNEAKRASLDQFGEFAGHQKIEPQAYYSDSHLDTLGFCFWLALAKRTNPKNKIIVLDDVFASVDLKHLGRIIDLIDSECEQFAQVFVLTHNRNWFDRYRFNQAVSGKAHKIELGRWWPAVGIRTQWTPTEVQEIADLALQFKNEGGITLRQSLSSRCGILLESLLGFISKQYRTSVPNTPDGLFTLGDLLSSCTKLFKVLEVHRHPDPIDTSNAMSCSRDNLDAQLSSLKTLSLVIRNGIGCHFNQIAMQLSDSEVEDFATNAVAFARAVTCNHDECGQIPQRDEHSYYRCSCKRTRFVLTRQP